MNASLNPFSTPTVVLVNGAFADAWSWSAVYQELKHDGVPVVAASAPGRASPQPITPRLFATVDPLTSPSPRDDADLLAALRRGDNEAFAALIDRHSPAMIRVATAYVPSRAAAEEAVQEAWIAVMRGIDGFEGRSSLKTWIFRILTNIAMRSGARERRTTPFSVLAAAEDTGEPTVDPDRFLPADHELFPGHWAITPTRWPTPEEGLFAGETREVIADAIGDLPEAQRTVIALRDVEGWTSEEVCEALEISAGNQRILLHRARSRVRSAIEDYFGAVEEVDYDAVTAELFGDTQVEEKSKG